MAQTTTVKRRIGATTLTIKVTANRINENGTFSSFEVVSATGPNKTFRMVAPPQGGGAIYLKVDSLEGIKILSDDVTSVTTEKKKLF
jgi:hypothetical protein